MERRYDTRIPIDLPVKYAILGSDYDRLAGHVRDVSEGGLRMTTDIVLNVGAFLRIQLEDCVLFGEVKYCCPWMGGYVSGCYVERVLLGDSEISRLISVTLQEVPRVNSMAWTGQAG